jgi:hypothetical protein
MGIKVKAGDVVVGELTSFSAGTHITGPVYEIKTVSPSDATQSRVVVPISDGAYYDPFEPKAAKPNPKPNRAQRRKRGKP